ncbi:MAG: 30S ribosome-binding factor RbfA [Candidatus Colwellbacteria bacterium]|nr:30S ribosome-binding factor RbfA [Candidatus Colwellbacteria bacterium]
MSFRKQQLNSLIRNELVPVIQKEVDFPAGVLTTITRVEVSDESERAAVFVSVIPSSDKEGVMRILKGKRSELQSFLFKRLKMRVVPQIYFEYDAGPEKAADIERIVLEEKN